MCWQSRSVTRADLHRSLLDVARASTISAARNFRVLALRQWTICAFSFCFRSTFLPPFAPRLLGVSQLVWRLSHPSAFHLRSCGDPRFTTPESPVVLSPTTLCPPMSAFFLLASFRVLGSCSAGPFPVCAHRISRLRHFTRRLAKASRPNRVSDRTDQQARLPLLSTPPYDDAVTVGFQPVEHLVESVFTSSSGALSGARVRRPCRRSVPGRRSTPSPPKTREQSC